MKVIAINGSPHRDGNTFRAIAVVTGRLNQYGIDTEVLHLGLAGGCTGCYTCAKTRDCKCCLPDDGVNLFIQKLKEADGVLIGAPVYYADVAGNLKGVLDRIATVCATNGNLLRHKVGAPLVVARRIGALPAFDTIMHFLAYAEMIIPCSNNWNTVFGRTPGEVERDLEGMQTLELLGENMAWLLRTISGETVPKPENQKKIFVNMIRKESLV